MDPLELTVQGGDLLEGRRDVPERACMTYPVPQRSGNLGPRGRSHPSRELGDIVFAEASRSLFRGCIRMRRDLPHRTESGLMDPADLGQHQQRTIRLPRLERLSVDPLRRVGLPLHFHVFTELLVPDRPTLG